MLPSQVIATISKHLLLTEVLFKFSRVSHQVRQSILDRISQIRDTRHLTVNITEQKHLPRKPMWITKCFNTLTITLQVSAKLQYFIRVMQSFSPNISLELQLQKFHDEQDQVEKLIELLGYYKIIKLTIDQCQIKLRASCMFLLQPPETLVIRNSFVQFSKYDQVLKCTRLYVSNSRLLLGHNNSKLFSNVITARLSQNQMKHNSMINFKRLERLWIKGSITSDQHIMTDVLALLILKASHMPLKLLSIQAAVTEDSVMHVLNGKCFPELEILTINYKYLTTTLLKIQTNMKLRLKKLNLKGCSIATRKKYKEPGYEEYARKRDQYGVRCEVDEPMKVCVGGRQHETDQSDELEIVRARPVKDVIQFEQQ